MIRISKSETADTRTCDWSQVSLDQLRGATESHIDDVSAGLGLFRRMLSTAAITHDEDKLTGLGHFHSDFRTGFKETGWYENHKRVSRHHIDKPEGVRDGVNIIDVLEHITDCVMSGMARSGSVYDLELPDELLQKAFQNTVALLKANVSVVEEP